jgi:hypothetical protein
MKLLFRSADLKVAKPSLGFTDKQKFTIINSIRYQLFVPVVDAIMPNYEEDERGHLLHTFTQ